MSAQDKKYEDFFELLKDALSDENNKVRPVVAAAPIEKKSVDVPFVEHYGSNTVFYDLFSKLDKSKSLIYSPLSVEEAFIPFHVSDEKAEPLATIYGENAVECYNSINKLLERSAVVKIANSMWINNSDGFVLLDKFKTDIATLSTIYCLPFDDKLQGIIDKWIEEKTNSMIKNGPKLPVDSELCAIVVNTIFFRGKWISPFRSSSVGPFTKFNRDWIMTDMMSERFMGECGYYEDHLMRAIKLNYHDNFSMIVILDKSNKLICPTESKLWEIFSEMSYAYTVFATIPKFRVEMEENLTALLPEAILGSYNKFGNQPIKIKGVIQKAVIEVNETGTTAAAVTTVCAYACAGSGNERYFNANVPFTYYIVHQPTKKVLFMGSFV
ncbi:MAG: hypothetical protein Harvfovirus35_18 [Harvfovirus sp.]|uniref:Serpin domain-containing protein n=1 Tax=Harvfovirus sp. TaxID=2487768 RepID=A0A3G5A7N9_9VIRU|nr:MAG: hypothetical protein Harvfovirus35_18 [Harvfovirus sp.]